MRELKVAIVCDRDPRDRRWWSGTLHYMCRAIQERFSSVDYLLLPADHGFEKSFGFRWRYYLTRLLGGYYNHQFSIPFARFASARIQEQLDSGSWDVLVALNSYPAIAYLRTTTPVVYVNDATFALLEDGYSMAQSRYPWFACEGNAVERRSIRNSAHIVYSSQWAKDSAVADYGADPARVHIVPFGANIDPKYLPSADEAASILESKADEPVFRLLLVGTDWERKGGDWALRALELLNERGVAAELTVIGMVPPRETLPDNVRVIVRLDKNKPEEMRELADHFARAHLFVLPTRAECTAIVYNEANAYATPVLTTDTGGVASVVRPEVNGMLVSLQAGPEEYAGAVQALAQDRERYRRLAQSSRAEFEERLNWSAWGASLQQILQIAARGG